ncbi:MULTISPECIES: sulfite oxidase [Natrialbaceae]|uniref:sulfite oxidase n=1 Tax=Natrialbaceae TaxID=1644061 RepID=UPI00207C34C9|nr:sulfite oxidase [Natronococcus sp. CG52]
MASGTLAGVAIAGRSSTASSDESDPPPDLRPGEEPESFEERYPGLRVMTHDPENAEAADRETYTKATTPTSEHYVRNHYPTPAIDADEWTIELRGLGLEDCLELDTRTLREEFSTESVAHTMQCSGNGRADFEPEVDGVPWTVGAVGTTVWTGAPLREVLEGAGAETHNGTWLVVAGGEHPEDEDVFARSLPVEKVLEDCILAYEMDGEPLTPDHGYPVRLVVPGWFGNNCVKWVAELEVTEKMHAGEAWADYVEWQHESYRMLAADQEPSERESIDEFDTRAQMDAEAAGEIDYAPYLYDQLVKSLVGYPGENATLEPREQDGRIEIVGVAWAGDDRAERVEISVDGGETWADADFFGQDLGPYGWRQFRYCWDAEPGEYTIVSRATDEHGRNQPRTVADAEEGLLTIEDDRFPWNQDGYGNNAYLPHGVDVTVVDDGCE